MKYKRIAVLVVVLLVASMLMAACGSDDKDDADTSPTTEQPVIKLVGLPWLAADLNVAVAKIILEEEMGYTVEVVPSATVEQWELVAAGNAHASLEVWTVSVPDEIQKYIEEDKSVEDGGALGAVGQSGWYVPRYMLDDYPEIHDWESLQDPALVAALATEETGDKGRFLAGDPAWNDQKISGIVLDNLGLNFEVQVAGTEEAEIEILLAAFEAKEPVLFYFWVPHWLFATEDLYRINLPPYSDECYAVLEEINCDFEEAVLLKILWPGLADYAPDAYQFLKNFTLTNLDQIRMMAIVELDEETVEQAARIWMAENETVWQAGVPNAE